MLQSTVFHGILLVACQGGAVFMWRNTEWVRLPLPLDDAITTSPMTSPFRQATSNPPLSTS